MRFSYQRFLSPRGLFDIVCEEWIGYDTSTPEYGAEVEAHSASSADANLVWMATRRSGSSRRVMVAITNS